MLLFWTILYWEVFQLFIYTHERSRILERPLNIMLSNTTPPLTMASMLKHITEWTPLWQCQQELNIIGIIKVSFMVEQLQWIALDCTAVPNKVDTESLLLWVKVRYVMREQQCNSAQKSLQASPQSANFREVNYSSTKCKTCTEIR